MPRGLSGNERVCGLPRSRILSPCALRNLSNRKLTRLLAYAPITASAREQLASEVQQGDKSNYRDRVGATLMVAGRLSVA